MPNRDAIELALSSPLDWTTFEKVVAEVLIQDDFPRLRKLGGGNDFGIDGLDTAFYGDESRTAAVVQITSQRAQTDKFLDTARKLRTNAIAFDQIVLVYRQPVSSSIRRGIQRAAADARLAVDVRDQDYLIAQLAKPGSTIFARYFQPLREQVDRLLGEQDPLRMASDRTRRAMLASAGAYVLNPQASSVRSALFDKGVIAVLVAAESPLVPAELASRLGELFPEENVDEDRAREALARLLTVGSCEAVGENGFRPSENSLALLGRVLAETEAAYDGILAHIFGVCSKAGALDDATRGYIERNTRRALLALLQTLGPLDVGAANELLDLDVQHVLLPILSRDLPGPTVRLVLGALAGYVADRENQPYVGTLARAYGALAIRNLDPLCRAWQRDAVARTIVALDTDTVLAVLIRELPEHNPVCNALQALARDGIAVVVPEGVFEEATEHIRRAYRSYRLLADRLDQLPPQIADDSVWHAVVRGFYYARRAGFTGTWLQYWLQYFARERHAEYVRYLLSQRLSCSVEPLDSIPQGWLGDLEAIAKDTLATKERLRMKAQFRDDTQMERRVLLDVRVALHLATYATDSSPPRATGYIVSEDRAFERMQRHEAWSPRPRVHLWTRALPQLAEVMCGARVSDEDLVRLLFEPVTSAAAHLLDREIGELTAVGVNLSKVSIDRLAWDLQTGLQDAVLAVNATGQPGDPRRFAAAVSLARQASQRGYEVHPQMREIVAFYDKTVEERDTALAERERVTQAVQIVIESAGGLSKKGRRRARRLLRELGIAEPGSREGPSPP